MGTCHTICHNKETDTALKLSNYEAISNELEK